MDALDQIVDQEIAAALQRLTPYRATDVKDYNLLNVLTNMILSWPLRDLRLNPDLRGQSTDSKYMQDVARGLKLKVAKKSLEGNHVTFRALALSNMDEYERHNLATQAHNERYEAEGEPDVMFDPVTGATKAAAGYMAPAIIENEHDRIPGTSPDAPKARRATVITLKYQVYLKGTTFTLGYTAEDRRGKLVYYNFISGDDLAALVRRSVQGLWGNPEVFGLEGPFLEGIAMLIQGKKTALCTQNNTKPLWALGQVKTANVDLLAAEATQHGLGFVGAMTGYVMPVVFAIWMLVVVYKALAGLDPVTEEWESGTQSGFIWGMGIVLVAIWVSFKVTAKVNEKAATTNMRKKFL